MIKHTDFIDNGHKILIKKYYWNQSDIAQPIPWGKGCACGIQHHFPSAGNFIDTESK